MWDFFCKLAYAKDRFRVDSFLRFFYLLKNLLTRVRKKEGAMLFPFCFSIVRIPFALKRVFAGKIACKRVKNGVKSKS